MQAMVNMANVDITVNAEKENSVVNFQECSLRDGLCLYV